jgi:hypothetical protein
VRGLCAIIERPFDLGQGTFPTLDNLVRPEAQDVPALAFHLRCAARIRFDLESMVVAVNLDDELPRHAGEIGKVRTDRMLSTELGPA